MLCHNEKTLQLSALPKVFHHLHTVHQKYGLGEVNMEEDPVQLPEWIEACWPRRGHLIIQHLLYIYHILGTTPANWEYGGDSRQSLISGSSQ